VPGVGFLDQQFAFGAGYENMRVNLEYKIQEGLIASQVGQRDTGCPFSSPALDLPDLPGIHGICRTDPEFGLIQIKGCPDQMTGLPYRFRGVGQKKGNLPAELAETGRRQGVVSS